MKGDQLDDWEWLFVILLLMLLLLLITVVGHISFIRLLELCFFESCDTAFPTR